MKTAYPVKFTRLDDGYMVYVPDMDAYTQGDSLTEAIDMARDVIGLMGVDMEDDKVNNVISIINNMDLKDKLRLGLCISSSSYTNLNYNKSHIYSLFDEKLKEIDNEYVRSYVNMRKYPTLLFTMSKIMEMNNTEQNKIAMYLYNTI